MASPGRHHRGCSGAYRSHPESQGNEAADTLFAGIPPGVRYDKRAVAGPDPDARDADACEADLDATSGTEQVPTEAMGSAEPSPSARPSPHTPDGATGDGDEAAWQVGPEVGPGPWRAESSHLGGPDSRDFGLEVGPAVEEVQHAVGRARYAPSRPTPDRTDAEARAEEPAARPDSPEAEPRRGLKGWVLKAVPWVSLAISITGAVLMDRSQDRAGLIAAAAAGSWLVMLLVELAHREPNEGEAGKLRKLVRFSSAAAGQSLVQMSLFFSAPFYLAAFGWSPPQVAFVAVFAVVVVIALWDPLCARFLTNPIGAPMLNGFASFVGFNAALPMLGIPNRYAVWIASAMVAVMVGMRRRSSLMRRAAAWGAAAAVPVCLALGAVRALPPAPLRLVDAGIGTRVEGRKLADRTERFAGEAPRRLVCWTAISAPLGLSEKLVHVWRHDGKVLSRVELSVRGGRKDGFRTWSRHRVARSRAQGEWRCSVETSLGQSLGSVGVMLSQ